MSDPEGMMNWLHASHEQARWLAQHGERGEVEFQRGRAAAFREAIETGEKRLAHPRGCPCDRCRKLSALSKKALRGDVEAAQEFLRVVAEEP